jgi:hypothetical protein
MNVRARLADSKTANSGIDADKERECIDYTEPPRDGSVRERCDD